MVPEEDSYHEWRTIYCRECGHSFRIPLPCKDRYCPVCSKIRASKIRRRLNALVKKQSIVRPNSIRFLTLTITNDENLSWMVRKLKQSFRRLRQLSQWKKWVTGGAYVIEFTYAERHIDAEGHDVPGTWHAHIHALIAGEFVPFKKLLSMWMQVSPGRGVYLKQVPNEKAVGYMTKYITKADKSLSDEQIREVNNTLKGARLFQPFGTWTGFSRDIPQVRPPCPKCESRCGYVMDWELRDMKEALPAVSRGSPEHKIRCTQDVLDMFPQSYEDPF